ncbi:MAG: aromatic ring-hydroxylating dioxygenase subunit alpha [Rhodospirillaceae bacterium]|nr:aromatic ring-hydroxylating dioxygenase subunit alpha [Rhodospirillaceae bacterium]MBT6509269.1 aromatic ring-hydroxylating dioxygenase subunit alpha [Rhodospirillaceae bacterium]MBT7648401.1 aromatic ring-hydroxylating dioxygenase subunit alpha [Rhodospirillaceae bacterium]
MSLMNPLHLDDFVSTEQLERLRRPANEAEGLPGRAFADPGFFELERQKLFPRGWMAVAFESDVAAPGDATPVSIAGWDLIVARNRQGEIKVFHNICRHRSMTVLREPCTKAQALQCPWHGWTYDLNGRLIATPDIGGMDGGSGKVSAEQPGIEKAMLGLQEVRSVTWLHFVFVNIDGKAEPFETFIQPVLERVPDHDLSQVCYSGLETQAQFDGNWKLAIETGCEDYHLPWVHPQIGERSGVFSGDRGGNTYVSIASKREKEVLTGDSLPLFPHHNGKKLGDDGLSHEIILFFIVPNAIVSIMDDHVVTNIYYPMAHDRTPTRRAFHFIGDAATDEKHRQTREKVRDIWIEVGEQDFPMVREVQTKHAQRDELGMPTRFSAYWESAVHHFQNLVVDRLSA